jgi:predicted kinase
MTSFLYINPDHYLGSPRIWSPERSKLAWEKSYADLENAFISLKDAGTLYVVCGAQGAGKSTWIRRNREKLMSNPAVVFDAALPGRRHRERAITMAKNYGLAPKAIWINTPLEIALVWNRQRALDEQVPDETLRTVFENFEPPVIEEGFLEVSEIKP